MYNNNDFDQYQNDQVHWNGSSYSTSRYRVEDVPAPVSNKKKNHGATKAIALVLCCALVGGGAGVGGAALYGSLNYSSSNNSPTVLQENNVIPSTTVSVKQTDGLTPMSLTEIYEAYVNSSVVISCEVPYTTNTWFGTYEQTGMAAGSGFIISDNGYIVTNYHVINGASSINVTTYDGTEYEATYVGGEESNDVAVLKIDATDLTPVVLGDSDSLQVGGTVCTIGNALGTLSFSQTSGAVSGLGRSVTYSDGTIMNMIQTDCTINSGNSGGPLFDSYGRVVGIVSAKYSNNGTMNSSEAAIENIGFAIPINDVKSMITDIMEHGYVVRPYMGITVATVTEQFAQYFNWPYGAHVNSVEPGSPADLAGIKQGDIITAIDGTEVTTSEGFVSAKNRYAIGDTAELTVYRSGETITLSITFTASSDPTESTQPIQEPAEDNEHSQGNERSQDGGSQNGGLYRIPFGG